MPAAGIPFLFILPKILGKVLSREARAPACETKSIHEPKSLLCIWEVQYQVSLVNLWHFSENGNPAYAIGNESWSQFSYRDF